LLLTQCGGPPLAVSSEFHIFTSALHSFSLFSFFSTPPNFDVHVLFFTVLLLTGGFSSLALLRLALEGSSSCVFADSSLHWSLSSSSITLPDNNVLVCFPQSSPCPSFEITLISSTIYPLLTSCLFLRVHKSGPLDF